jgi:hypothetical protein
MIETNFEKLGRQIDVIGMRLYSRAMKHPGEVRKELAEFGWKTHSSIVYSMMYEPKTGRVYKYKKRRYRASAPGESPAVRSSKLIKAIAYTTRKNQVEVGALKRAYWAKYLEPETARGLRNRPFLMKNVNRHWPATAAKIANILGRVDRSLIFTKTFHHGLHDRII